MGRDDHVHALFGFFYLREPNAMDLRNSNMPKFALAITIFSFLWNEYYVKVKSTHDLEISALE